MNHRFNFRQRASRATLAVLAALTLVTAAAWRTTAATRSHAPQPPSATPPAPRPRAPRVRGARDSSAAASKPAAPAVVAVRANGKARVSPTQFQVPDDDLLRRFFGDQFDRNSRRPRQFRQSALGSGVIVS